MFEPAFWAADGRPTDRPTDLAIEQAGQRSSLPTDWAFSPISRKAKSLAVDAHGGRHIDWV
jgi:hypothetical protein